MKPIQIHSVAFSILCLVFAFSAPLHAAESGCSFNSMVTADEFSYRIFSNPVNACNKQLLSISVLKDALPFTQFVNSSDFVAETAWGEDIDDDGRLELMIVSHKSDNTAVKTIEIFSIDGNILKQARLPELVDKTGYRGGDRFLLEGGRIVRSYPVYLSKDVDGKPTGGEKRIPYQYRNRELLLAVSTTLPGSMATAGKTDTSKKIESVKITGIQAKQDYIEIKTSSPIDKYKVFRISDPWRLVMDFPGVVTDIQDKTVIIDRFGISRARIGLNKGFVRLVFDSAVSPLPTETVTPAENAIRIGFYSSK